MEKACSKCGTVKPLDEFHKKKGRSDGRRSECKACSKSYRERTKDRKYRLQNERYASDSDYRDRKLAQATRRQRDCADEVRKYQRDYQCKRRAKLKGGDFDFDIALQLYGDSCGICGEKSDDLTVGHIIPVARGGGNHQWNIRPECPKCNRVKWKHLDCELGSAPISRPDLAAC